MIEEEGEGGAVAEWCILEMLIRRYSMELSVD